MKRGRHTSAASSAANTAAPTKTNQKKDHSGEDSAPAAGNWKDLKYKTGSSNVKKVSTRSVKSPANVASSSTEAAAAAVAAAAAIMTGSLKDTTGSAAKKKRVREEHSSSVAAASIPADEDEENHATASSSKGRAAGTANTTKRKVAEKKAITKDLSTSLVSIVAQPALPVAVSSNTNVLPVEEEKNDLVKRKGRQRKVGAKPAVRSKNIAIVEVENEAENASSGSRMSRAPTSPNSLTAGRTFYWSKEKLQKLHDAVRKHGTDWEVIAKEIGNNVNWHQCLTRWKFEVGHGDGSALALAAEITERPAAGDSTNLVEEDSNRQLMDAEQSGVDAAIASLSTRKSALELEHDPKWTQKLDKRLLRVLKAAAKKMNTDPPLSVQECVDRYHYIQQLEDKKRDGSFYDLPEDMDLMTTEQRRKVVARNAARNRRLAAAEALSTSAGGSLTMKSTIDTTGSTENNAVNVPALYKVQGGYCSRPYLWSDELHQKLMDGFGLYGKDWEKVAEYVGDGKTAKQCSTRWNYIAEVKLSNCKIGPWSIEEKHELMNYLDNTPEGQQVLQQLRDGNISEEVAPGAVRKHRFERKFWVPLAGKLNRTVRDCSTTFRNILDSQRKGAMKKGPLSYDELMHIKQNVIEWTARGEKQGFWQQMEKDLNRPAGNLERRWHKRLMYEHKRTKILDIGDLTELAKAHCAGSNEKIEEFNKQNAGAKEARAQRVAEKNVGQEEASSSSAPAVETTVGRKKRGSASSATAASKSNEESDAEKQNLISAAIGGLFGLISNNKDD